MLAVVKENFGPGIMIKEVEKPVIRNSDVLVKVERAGICGSDVPVWNGIRKVPLPFISGHEYVGTIVQAGNDVKGFKVGDRVIPGSVQNCFACSYCREGMEHLCDDLIETGIHVNGAFAEYVAAPYVCLHHCPEGMDLNVAVFADPVASAYHPIKLARINSEENVVVFGPGAIGLMMVQLAKLEGAKKIILAGTRDARLDIGKELGADHTINVRDTKDVTGTIRRLLGGGLADVVLEASGQAGVVATALQVVKKGGRVIAESIYHENSSLMMTDVVRKEITIIGSICYTYFEFEHCIHLLKSGKIVTAPLISHEFALRDAEKALEALNAKRALKVLLKP